MALENSITDDEIIRQGKAVTSLDGRYSPETRELGEYVSTFALQRDRVEVEIEFLIFLLETLDKNNCDGIRKVLSAEEKESLRDIYRNFSAEDFVWMARKEKFGGNPDEPEAKPINHDVKAVELFVRKKLKERGLEAIAEWVHCFCTSEDITNLAHGRMMINSREKVMLPAINQVMSAIREKALNWAGIPMLGHTHGQPATPTTFGKTFAVFAARLEKEAEQLKDQPVLGKINGATGTYSAHAVAYPQIDWMNFSSEFVKSLGMTPNLVTEQIEPHDYIAATFDNISRINTILLDAAQDMWFYIMLQNLKQKAKEGEVGSSTMPNKVNPIDFENAEGNLHLANALLQVLARELPQSRMQRHLSDSTMLRNLGTVYGYCLLAYKGIKKGLSKIEVDEAHSQKELENNPEVLAEAIQQICRKWGIKGGYDLLKEVTRGKRATLEDLRQLVEKLDFPAEATADKERLLTLTPATYTGLAEQIAKSVA